MRLPIVITGRDPIGKLYKVFDQAVAERDAASNQPAEILHSRSWQLTRGFRAIRCYLITWPNKVLRNYLGLPTHN